LVASIGATYHALFGPIVYKSLLVGHNPEPVTHLAPQDQQKVCPACNTRYDGGGAFCARDGTRLVSAPDANKTSDLVGQVLADRYRLVRCIGEGGMGQVYEAQHVNINRRFAIKLLKPEIVSNPEAVARFRQEAWSASSIGHENIIEIDDFATLPNGSVYLAMEFLEGMSLAERMRTSERLSLDEMLDILIQTCRGLEAAHQKNIVHRDMKPENIFLVERNERLRAKILDFGIAKVSGAEGSQNLTRTGTIFGTPFYMSPEQALGKPLDLRTDIYSMGVIMYELFTGRVPFEAESFMGILTKHITTAPLPPRQFAPDREIPEAIEQIILRAMAKELEERYADMAALLRDLETASQLAFDVPAAPARTTTGNQRVPSGPSEIAQIRKSAGAVDPHDLEPLRAKKSRGLAVVVVVLLVVGSVAAVLKKKTAMQVVQPVAVAPTAAAPAVHAQSPAPTAPVAVPAAPVAVPTAIAAVPPVPEASKPVNESDESHARTDAKSRHSASSKRPAKTAASKTAAAKSNRPAMPAVMVDPYERLDDKKGGGGLMDPYK
jgi:serine/threonine protein kinase